ncbi:MAG: thioredoxin-dependent thiol peroxidase [Chloroflexi bacterium]|nr:thioredoxin-dependent thiol peroxidase [Chloroflexota bacterium]
MLQEGDLAPDFALPSDSGQRVKLADLRGKKVVLYFYPKDNTPGCTAEACSFRDEYAVLQNREAVVLGVSPDSVTSHSKFKNKHSLPFPLLADTEHKVAEAYGVWVEKSRYGRKYWGNARTTFILDEQGRIAKIFSKVKPQGHGKEVLAALET